MDWLSPVLTLINKFIPDPAEQAKLAVQLQQIEADLRKSQSETNTAEAGNSNLFVSGWRPFIGWCCGVGFLYGAAIQPMLHGIVKTVWHVDLPPIDTNAVYSILGGMLGLGAMRTTEKVNGVAETAVQFFGKKKK